MALLLAALFFVRLGIGWIYNRTGSLALIGLVHGASNAMAIGLV